MMDDLPAILLSAIDVCDAMIYRNLLSGKAGLPALRTDFVGHSACNLNHLIIQPYPPLRGDLGHLLKRVSNLVPTYVPSPNRMHGRYDGVSDQISDIALASPLAM